MAIAQELCPWDQHTRPTPATMHGLCAECHKACVEQGTCEICYPDPHVVLSNPDLELLDQELDTMYRGQM